MKLQLPLIIVISMLAAYASAQELEPRAYQPAPVGVNAFVLSYGHSTGDILFEPSFPAKNVHANLHFQTAGLYRSFDFFGRFANISAGLPYARGYLNGTVEGVPTKIFRSGLGDFRLKFAVNLKGTPGMTLPQFIKHRRSKTTISASLLISAPTGQYNPRKVINIGQNRWAFKPEVGFSRFYKKWQMDAYGGAWFFTENNNFLGGTNSQKPVGSFQFHMSYNLRPTLWFGFDTNYYTGGRTVINEIPGNIIQNNARLGGTVSFPVAKTHFMKLTVSHGLFTSRGGDFTSVGVSYNYAWGAKK